MFRSVAGTVDPQTKKFQLLNLNRFSDVGEVSYFQMLICTVYIVILIKSVHQNI